MTKFKQYSESEYKVIENYLNNRLAVCKRFEANKKNPPEKTLAIGYARITLEALIKHLRVTWEDIIFPKD